MMNGGLEDRQYQEKFNPLVFLKQRFRTPGTPMNQFRDMRLELLHQFFTNVCSTESKANTGSDLKVLDYGSGPVVAFALSAAGIKSVSEIVLAEYTAKNRDALVQWLEKKPLAFNWLPYIKHVVKHLENKSEEEVQTREERLRNLIKVVSCDIKAEPPIEEGYEGPYDIVMTHLAIGSACENEADYTRSIKKLSKLVKLNGFFYMFSKLSAYISQPMFYKIGEEHFYYYAVTDTFLMRNLENAGFEEIKCQRIPISKTVLGLSEHNAEELEIHTTSSEDFYYASVIAKKAR